MSPNDKQSTPKLIWYASYGSNLKFDRFMCYIRGGTPEGSTKNYDGCREKSEPIESRPRALNFELYFTRESETWEKGGVAFIRENPGPGPTLSGIYLITDEQFNAVVMQENSKKPDGSRFVPPFDELVSKQESRTRENGWYGRILNLGLEGGYPILTFTTARANLEHPPTAPSERYMKVIASGIKETYPGMSDDDIAEYLFRADGVRGNIALAKIRDWVAVT